LWFIKHNNFKKRVIEHIIETYKITLAEGTQTIDWVDDNMIQQITIDGAKLGDSDYGLYVSDNVKEQELFELLKNQAQSMLQNGLLAVSDLVKIYKNDSMAELEATIKYKELKLEQNQQQQIQHEQELAQQAQALEQQRHDEEMMFEREKLDREDVNGNYNPENCCWRDRSWQQYNQRQQCKNTSGKTGVSFYKAGCVWEAYIHKDGKKIDLGKYKLFEDAVEAREQAELEYFGRLKGN